MGSGEEGVELRRNVKKGKISIKMYFLIRNQGEQINGGERHKWEDEHKNRKEQVELKSQEQFSKDLIRPLLN